MPNCRLLAPLMTRWCSQRKRTGRYKFSVLQHHHVHVPFVTCIVSLMCVGTAAQVPGGANDSLSSNTHLGRAVQDACNELETLGGLVRRCVMQLSDACSCTVCLHRWTVTHEQQVLRINEKEGLDICRSKKQSRRRMCCCVSWDIGCRISKKQARVLRSRVLDECE
jgi:hypothetical protein